MVSLAELGEVAKSGRRHKEYPILVTGDRNWSNQQVVDDVLDRAASRAGKRKVRLVEGGAKGADAAAADWAKRRGYEHSQVKANWAKHHRAAGPIRNRMMLHYRPREVIGFHDDIERSKGTANMLSQAAKARNKPLVDLYNSQGQRTRQYDSNTLQRRFSS